MRHTIRLLLKSPGFTITAILILGFGIGVNTAVFSLIDGVLLKPLPYPNPNQLVNVLLRAPDSGRSDFDYPDFIDLSGAQRSFDTLCVSDGGDWLDWREGDYATRVNVDFASRNIRGHGTSLDSWEIVYGRRRYSERGTVDCVERRILAQAF
jgi:hypothetical protein